MRVVAILVARTGGDPLAATVASLAAQTRAIDVLLAVDNGSRGTARAELEQARPAQLISTGGTVPFGEAVEMAARVVAASGQPDDLLWLLNEYSAPHPTALQRLVGALDVARSTAIVGPKQFAPSATAGLQPPVISEFGWTMSPTGRALPWVEDELDQGQFDNMSDVLGVGANGMLLRAAVWRQLGGFDDALPDVDDALDFCVRARLCGHLVQVVPSAGVTSRADECGENGARATTRARRRRAWQRRRAELYRRQVYSRAPIAFLLWFTLVPWAMVRIAGHMLAKRPGLIFGELVAAFSVALSLGSIARARSRLNRQKSQPWAALAGVRLSAREVRQRNALAREATRIRLRGERRPLSFFAGGGAWTTLALTVISVAMLFPLVGAFALGGGALLPLGQSASELWGQVGFGWREGSPGLIGPADPFALVMALLGSLTWWQPSVSVVILWFAAIPVSGLGAWMLATRVTERPVIRAFGALAYGLAPTLLVALTAGRPAAVIAHIALPWMFFAGFRAVRSWSASATTALLSAIVVACAPSLIPALLVIWIGTIVLTGRAVPRFLAVSLPAAVLFAPLVFAQASRWNPLALVGDPGAIVAVAAPEAWQVVLGFPTPGLGGWLELGDATPFGLSFATGVVVVVLVGVLATFAVVGLFSAHPARSQVSLLVMLLGLVTAVGSTAVQVSFDGSVATHVWPGTGLSLAWLALTLGAMMGVVALRRFSVFPAIAGMLSAVMLAAPLLASLYLDRADVAPSDDRVFPAYVVAQASRTPNIGTLVLTAQSDGGISAALHRGLGETLANSSTLVTTNTALTEPLARLSSMVGNLVSTSGKELEGQLQEAGIGFVLLTAPQSGFANVTAREQDAQARASAALQAKSELEQVGQTDVGLLWRVPSLDTGAIPDFEPLTDVEPARSLLLTAVALVLLLTVLLALPTGSLAPARAQRDEADEDTPVFEPEDALAGDDEPQN